MSDSGGGDMEYAKNRQENDMEFRAIKATAQRRRKARMRADAGLPSGGKHEIGNLQILTAIENLQKGERPTPPCHHRGAHDA
jgi:hypothetical protein